MKTNQQNNQPSDAPVVPTRAVRPRGLGFAFQIVLLGGWALLVGTALAAESGRPLPGKPVLLSSTYFGGSGNDRVSAIAVDGAGGVYAAGFSTSSNFPISGDGSAAAPEEQGCLVIAKFDRELKTLQAGMALAGASRRARIAGLALDPKSGDVILAGFTDAMNFPTTPGAFQKERAGGQDLFVARVDAGLKKLKAATFLGGQKDDCGYGVVLDASGNIYVAGRAESSNYPTTSGGYCKDFNGGACDIVISKLNGDLSKLLASTFVGGAGSSWAEDVATGIALDSAGNVVVAGYTASTNYPVTPGAYTNAAAATAVLRLVISKLDGKLEKLLASCIVGASKDSYARGLALDKQNNVIVAGCTRANNYPAPNIVGPYWQNRPVAILSKFDPDLTNLMAAVVLGATSWDDPAGAAAVCLDPAGAIYATGSAIAPFDIIGASFNPCYGGSGDAFLAKLDGDLKLQAATFLGGSDADQGACLAPDGAGGILAAGWTKSTNYPVTPGACRSASAGGADFFISRLSGDFLAADRKELVSKTDRDAPAKTRWQDTILVANFDTPYPLDTSSAGENDWRMGTCVWKHDGADGWLEFNGGEYDYLRIENRPSLNPANLTVSLWFKLPATATDNIYPFLYSKGGNGSKAAPIRGWGMYARYAGGKWQANCEYPYLPPEGVPGTNWLPEAKVGQIDITPEVWHHAAVTYDGKSMTFYLDGALTTNTPNCVGVLTNTPWPLLIGRRAGDHHESGRFPGALDNLRIYKVPLSAGEIKTLHKLGRHWE